MDRRRRILHIIFSLAAEGCPRLALDMVRLHDQKHYDTAVAYCVDTPADLRSAFEAQGVPMFHLKWRPKGFLPLAWRSYQLCRRWQPDGIICYTLGMHLFIGLGAWLAGVQSMVVHIGNTPPHNRWHARKIAWMLQLGRPFMRYAVACSDHVKDRVQTAYRLPEKRVKRIYNAAPVEEIHARASVWREHGQRSLQSVVGMVARLENHKDQTTLLHAFALVHQKQPAVTLRLIGEGSQRQRLEALAQQLGLRDVVQFLGSRHDIPEQLAAMDVFAFSTTPDEGFGIALVEALAAGVPVVATDVGACREVLEGGHYGYLVPPSDPHALAEALLTLLENAVERRRLSLQGYAYVLQHFDAMTMTRAYEEALFG